MPLWLKSTPGAVSTSFGSWPDAAIVSICSSEITVTDAGASTMRSVLRDAAKTVMVSATLSVQSTLLFPLVVWPAVTATPASLSALSPAVKVSE